MRIKWAKLFSLLFLMILVSLIVYFVFWGDVKDINKLLDWVGDQGTLGIVIFIAFYIVATVVFIPGSVITLSGGALFGPIWGTVFNLLGASIGALLSFLISRYYAGTYWQKKFGSKSKALIDGVNNEGWKFVAFVRLVPVFPFNVLNYLLGLTKIPKGQYFITSFICMIPGGAAYTYFGHALKTGLIDSNSQEKSNVQLVLISLGFLLILVYLPYFIRKYWRKNSNANATEPTELK